MYRFIDKGNGLDEKDFEEWDARTAETLEFYMKMPIKEIDAFLESKKPK